MHVTLKQAAVFRGVGLHGGAQVTLAVRPAAPGSGIVFERTDRPAGARRIPARFDLVSDTQLCTRLTNEFGVSVGTVEHVMAALAGAGISDAVLALDGDEVPIMDGSARPFLQGFARAGLRRTPGYRRAIEILETVTVESEGRRASLAPAPSFSIAFEIDFADAAIGRQEIVLDMTRDAFAAELGDCRTFGHLAEVEHLRRLGLARGGSLENAIVIDRGRVLNVGGLRRPDEFVRHKVLDAVGDLALAGAPIVGAYTGVKAGHGMTNLLLRALFARPSAWRFVPLPADAMTLGHGAHQPHAEPAAVAV